MENRVKKIYCGLILLIVLIAARLVPSVFAGEPGSGPADALRVTGTWQTIAANTSLWFYFDYGGDKSIIEVAVDDNNASNVELAVFTPAQANDWVSDPSTPPIGRGTKPAEDKNFVGHDLDWEAAFRFGGRYFVVVTNKNTTPVSFLLTVTGKSVTLYPQPTPTSLYPYLDNPFATPIATASIQGKLVFQEASGGNIYTVNGDGSKLTRVSYGLDPAWSPDGTQIAFTRWNEPAGLYVANADGSNEARVFDGQQFLSPRWSPDGKRIVFTRPSSRRQDWKIGVVEMGKVVGDVTKNVLTEPQCTRQCFAPTWHVDNHTLVYVDAGFGIMATDALQGAPYLLYSTPKVQATAYSPDATKIAFQVAQHDHWEIAVLNADGSVNAVTHPDPLSFRVVNNVAPTWSPDGRQILFLSDRSGKWELFVINADGSDLHQVLKNVTDAITIRYNFSNERVIDWTK